MKTTAQDTASADSKTGTKKTAAKKTAAKKTTAKQTAAKRTVKSQTAEEKKVNMRGVPSDLVFGLDIGTRSVVGTVGYKAAGNNFVAVAQVSIEHETRAMMDGQIHDINQVAETIRLIHEKLEAMTGRKFQDVCIAAAGRVLKTVEADAEIVFQNEVVIDSEQIYTLDMLGVERAYEILREEKHDDDLKFYCVGYSVKHYYQNDFVISNLEGHKCNRIREELIATFLPDEVVDGLYAAVERAGLFVANLTLEPIAAINVAIPVRFRLLNIALVDVGAGTSDISITKDGSIIAYGMIPAAGDEVTECLAKHYLTDFAEADYMKCASTEQDTVEFQDIMGLPVKVTSEEIVSVVSDTVKSITKQVADKIIELNGGKSVSAVFVVGGGGKVIGFVESLAEYLSLPKERVALRGSEVLGEVKFLQKDVNVDSLLVTPIGICLNYYEQRNNFIFVTVNGERVKLYDNSKLTITDAAIQVGFPNEDLFPKRGKSIEYYVNGKRRMQRGKVGEAASIKLNGKEMSMSSAISQNDKIEIEPSTVGSDATLEISSIPEYKSTMNIIFNGKEIHCPRFVAVNGELVSGFYEISDGDKIEILAYYTLEQVLEFMDIVYRGRVYVNNAIAEMDEKVYDNFSISCEILKDEPNYEALIAEYGDEQIPKAVREQETYDALYSEQETEADNELNEEHSMETDNTASGEDNEGGIDADKDEDNYLETESGNNDDADGDGSEMENSETQNYDLENDETGNDIEEEHKDSESSSNAGQESSAGGSVEISVLVNGEPVVLSGKNKYILVDVLDFYPFDTSVAHGDRLETKVNSEECDFVHPLENGDHVVLRWVK